MGRPALFERNVILERAMNAFWDDGYHATSMSKLVEATQLQPGSLYAAFKSKEELYMAAVEHYATQSRERFEEALQKFDSPLEAIRNFFKGFAERLCEPESRRGCLMVNTILEIARKDDAIRTKVKSYLDVNESLFREALIRAQERGELAAYKDPKALATFLMTNVWGLRVLSGLSPEEGQPEAVVEQLLLVLD